MEEFLKDTFSPETLAAGDVETRYAKLRAQVGEGRWRVERDGVSSYVKDFSGDVWIKVMGIDPHPRAAALCKLLNGEG